MGIGGWAVGHLMGGKFGAGGMPFDGLCCWVGSGVFGVDSGPF